VRLLLEVCALYYCPASPTSPATSTLPSLPSLPETTNNYLSSRAHFVAVHCLRLIRIDSHRHGHGGSLLETAFNFALLDTAALRGTATLSSSMSSSSSLKQMVRVCVCVHNQYTHAMAWRPLTHPIKQTANTGLGIFNPCHKP
jgi:hypothetical protein